MSIKLVLSILLFGLIGCGSLKKKEEVPQQEPSSAIVIGEVTSVHPEQGFLLFRRYGPGQLLIEGILSARSPNGQRAATLTLSPEKLNRFYTADFDKSGPRPREGDLIILSRGEKDKPEEANELTSEEDSSDRSS